MISLYWTFSSNRHLPFGQKKKFKLEMAVRLVRPTTTRKPPARRTHTCIMPETKTTPPQDSVNDDKLENTDAADAARARQAAAAKEAKQKEEKQRTHSPHFLSHFTARRPLLPRAISLMPTATTFRTTLTLPGPHATPPSRTSVVLIPSAPAVRPFLHRTGRGDVARGKKKAQADQKKESARLAAQKKKREKERAEERKDKARKAAEKSKERKARVVAAKKPKDGERSSNDDDDDDDFDDPDEATRKKKPSGDTCTIYSRMHIHMHTYASIYT